MHPVAQGKNLSNIQIERVMEFFEVYGGKIGFDEKQIEAVYTEAIQFKTHTGPWAAKYIWVASTKIDAITWWSQICPQTNLQKVAYKVLQALFSFR